MSDFPVVQGVSGGLQSALTERSKVQTTQSGNFQHIRYDSYTGAWSFGKDNEELTGWRATIITDSIAHGWHLWVDREVTKRMVGFTENLPEKPESREDRKGNLQTANEARGFQCVLEDEDGVQMQWEHSTDGCRRAIDTVLDVIRGRAMEEAEYLYPVIVFGQGTAYENSYKAGEMIVPPQLDIIGWRNMDGKDAPDGVVVAIKKKPKKAEAKVVAKPEDTDEDGDEGVNAQEEADAGEADAGAEEEAPRRRQRRHPTPV
jgi:hypothetical protein